MALAFELLSVLLMSRILLRYAWLAAAVTAQLAPTPARAAVIRIGPGEDLQVALVNAQPGDVIELAERATFTGNYTLPRKDGSAAVIVIRTALSDPIGEGRITPAQAVRMAKLRSPNSSPALQTAPGAHHWRVELIEITGANTGDLVTLGDASPSQNSLGLVPHDLVVDRCYVHGDARQGVKRCIALNSASTVVSNSHVSDCKAVGQDSQAIAGWNGPGPFSIVNNYLEGAGENVLFGGADPAIAGLVPSDITIQDNLIAKPPAWRQQQWQVKNLLELKNARRVTITGNILEYNWEAAQSGHAILFTTRNQDGRCRWCQVQQVTFTKNVLRHVASGFQILGYDDAHPSQQTRGIEIRDNVFTDINPAKWGGNGYAFLLLGGPRDIVIDHNTLIHENASGVIQVDGPPILEFVFTNNLTLQGAYGVIGSDHAPGNDTFRTFFPAALVTRNVIAEGDPGNYPSGNLFPSAREFRSQFLSYDDGNYQLTAGSRWRSAGTDGRDLGATTGPLREREPRERGDRRRDRGPGPDGEGER
jgi:hypothetical protein